MPRIETIGHSPKGALEFRTEDPVQTFINSLGSKGIVSFYQTSGEGVKSWTGLKKIVRGDEPISLLTVWDEVDLSFLIAYQATGCFRTGVNGQLTTILIKNGEIVYREGPTSTDPHQLNFLEAMGINR